MNASDKAARLRMSRASRGELRWSDLLVLTPSQCLEQIR